MPSLGPGVWKSFAPSSRMSSLLLGGSSASVEPVAGRALPYGERNRIDQLEAAPPAIAVRIVLIEQLTSDVGAPQGPVERGRAEQLDAMARDLEHVEHLELADRARDRRQIDLDLEPGGGRG